MRKTLLALSVVTAISVQGLLPGKPASAAVWTFGNDANGLTGLSAKAFSPVEGFQLELALDYPEAGRFFEGDWRGLSVDSTGIAGVTDLESGGIINLLTVGGAPAAAAESVVFSFDRPGVLTGIDFDGVKDEALEYFVLTTSGVRLNFFDSFANTSIPGAVDAALGSQVTGEVVYLLETGPSDDEARGLAIPFSSGQKFVLTYAELAAVADPLYQAGNGARLQGITVEAIPEPAAGLMFAVGLLVGCLLRERPRWLDTR